MYVETLGHGDDLVLIHGWAMHGGIFAPLTELLRERFRLHVVDLPGHGYSRTDTSSLQPKACAAELLAELPRAVWIGWSLGGLVSLQAALDAPDQVRGIVQIASSPRFLRDADWPGVERVMFSRFARDLQSDYRVVVERFLALEALGSLDPQDTLRELRARVFERGEPALSALHEGLQILETADLRAATSTLTVPNFWVSGRRDKLVPSAAMQQAAQANARGAFVEMPSGHAPFISHAHDVAAAITRFAEQLA